MPVFDSLWIGLWDYNGRSLARGGQPGPSPDRVLAIARRAGVSAALGRLSVATRVDGSYVVVSISDTGGSIPDEISDKIFDPFFTTKELGKGTGQGFSVARAVVMEKHHGELRFETKLGEGTTFIICLPIDGGENDGSAMGAAA